MRNRGRLTVSVPGATLIIIALAFPSRPTRAEAISAVSSRCRKAASSSAVSGSVVMACSMTMPSPVPVMTVALLNESTLLMSSMPEIVSVQLLTCAREREDQAPCESEKAMINTSSEGNIFPTSS